MQLPAWIQRARNAVSEAITEDDIKQIVKKQVELAKSGDQRACRFIFDFLLGGTKPPNLTQNVFNVQLGSSVETEQVPPSGVLLKVHAVLEAMGPLTAKQIAANINVSVEDVLQIIAGNTRFKQLTDGKYALAVPESCK